VTATLSDRRLRRLRVEVLTPEQYVQRFPPPRRCDRYVLRDLAAKADWSPGTWGQHAFPSVPAIAERIGYSVRSVQYALRRLTADGRLELVDRPGRTNVCRIVRHLAAVDEPPDSVDNPVSAVPAVERVIAPGGAKVAPDLGPPPRDTPPLPPHAARKGRSDAGEPAAHAPPERRDPTNVTLHGPPPGPVAPSEELLPTAGGPGRSRLSRDAARARRCPVCLAPSHEPCVGKGGRLRRAVHAERRAPVLSRLSPGYLDQVHRREAGEPLSGP
jgi:hypothetical protein